MSRYARLLLCFVVFLGGGHRAGRAADAARYRFQTAADLAAFQQLTQLEKADYEPWLRCAVAEGALVLEPRPAGFYQDYRGPALVRSIDGDFVATLDLQVTGRDGVNRPRIPWCTAGLLLRRPRSDLGADWQAGRENYLRLGLGTAQDPATFHYELYNTRNSQSRFSGFAAPDSGRARLRIVRHGAHFLVLAAPAGEAFSLLERVYRPDLPQTLQIGIYALSDWDAVKDLTPSVYNRQGPRQAGNPDVRARVDGLSIERPALPAALADVNWSRAEELPDARILSLFGAAGPDAAPAPATTPATTPAPAAAATTPPAAAATTPPAPRRQETAGGETFWSDEFDDAATLRDWKRIKDSEGKGAEQLETITINSTRKGHLTLIPRTVVWYQDWRGPLVYREVTGDFVATTEIETQRRGGGGAPRSAYSLCGLMLRAPRDLSGGWRPGGENYIFLSTGSARSPGVYQLEVKTTVNSNSQLQVTDGAKRVVLRAVRLGDSIVLMRKEPGGDWQVHARYTRRDFPATLQVGITCYTDWDSASKTPPAEHNVSALKGGNPDLEAFVDYVRVRNFDAAKMPDEYKNRNYADPNDVGDAFFLRYFGSRLD